MMIYIRQQFAPNLFKGCNQRTKIFDSSFLYSANKIAGLYHSLIHVCFEGQLKNSAQLRSCSAGLNLDWGEIGEVFCLFFDGGGGTQSQEGGTSHCRGGDYGFFQNFCV